MIDDNFVSDFWEYTPIKQTIIESIENLKLKNIPTDKILIFAGSGMSQESGIPVFHGSELKGGLSQKEGVNLVNMYEPHQGYTNLLNFCENKEYYVMTSNIDGYFIKAGFDPERVIEVHGNINYMQCPYKCTEEIFNYEEGLKCKKCDTDLVPNVMVSGFCNFISKTGLVENNMDISISTENWTIIEIGAGVLVPVIRDYSEILVEDKNFSLIRINPEHWQISEDILSKNTVRIPHKSILGINIILEKLLWKHRKLV
jgi:NAD-dependent SIR2 family protein deacetylase